MAEKKFCPWISYVDKDGMIPFDCDPDCGRFNKKSEECVDMTIGRLLESIWNTLRFPTVGVAL